MFRKWPGVAGEDRSPCPGNAPLPIIGVVLYVLADGKGLSWPFIAFPLLSALENEARTFTGDR